MIVLDLVLLFAIVGCASPLPFTQLNHSLQYITLEEHYVPPAQRAALVANPLLQLLVNGSFGQSLVTELTDGGTARLKNLDQNGIRMQIVSNANYDPTNVTAAYESNNAIHQNFLLAHPTRFGAWCALAMANPAAAAQELERCVTQLGFVGGLINANLPNGSFFDSPAYWTVFATAVKLGVPIYLHPGFPPIASILKTGGLYAPAIAPNGSQTFDDYIAVTIASDSWGFESGAGLAFMRLYSAGLFDAYPNLKMILGHVGEMVPYILKRSNYFLDSLTDPRKDLVRVWAENIWITTSGYFWLDPIPTLLTNTARDRIIFSVDTPFNKNCQGKAFMEKLRGSGLVTAAEFEGIAFRNAERLLGLNSTRM